MEKQEIQFVSMAAYEAQAERNTRLLCHLMVGWVLCVVVLAIVLLFAISYETELTEEVVTETTTYTDVAQDTGDNGSNYYAGRDFNNGNTDGSSAGEDDNNDQEENDN